MLTFFKWQEPSRVDAKLEKKAEAERQWRAVCKAVDQRDGRMCRCCDKRSDPEATGLLRGHRHHLVYRSAGGQDTTENLVTLCAKCHDDEHRNRLQITGGNANNGLTFWRQNPLEWFIVREEVSPGVVRKD